MTSSAILRLLVVALSLAIAAGSGSAHAATLTWDANGTTAGVTDGAGAWWTANRWWNGSSTITWTNGNDAVFGVGGMGGAVTLSATTVVASLTLNTFSGTYTLGTSGTMLTINAGGLTMNSGAGGATIVSPITLGAAQSWTNNSTSPLAVSGNVTNGGNTLTVAGSGNSTLSGTISGAGGLTKSDAGTLTLSASNTFTGTTAINAGVLQANNASALGGGTIAFGGGTLQYTAASAGQDWAARFRNSAAAIALDTNGQNVTLAAAIDSTNVGGLTKSSAGTLTLSGSNTYAGTTTINAGMLQFVNPTSLYGGTTANWTAANIVTGSGATLAVSAGASNFTAGNVTTLLTNLGGLGGSVANNGLRAGSFIGFDTSSAGGSFTVADSIADSTGTGGGAIGLVKLGSGTLTLSGSNSYSGVTTVSAGSLVVGHASALGAQSATVVVPSGGVLDLGGYGVTRTGTVSVTGGTLQSGTITNNTTAFDAQAGTVSAILAGSAGLTKSTSGTLTLSGSNAYSGATTVSAGSLVVGNASALGAQSGNLVVAGGVLNLGGLNVTRTGTVSFTGGTLQSGTLTNNTVAFDAQSGTASATLVGIGLTKSTSGTFTLTSSFLGPMTVNDGVFVFNVGFIGGSQPGASLTVNSGTAILGSNNNPWANAPITVNSGGVLTLTSNSNKPPNVQDLTLNGGQVTTSSGVGLNMNSATIRAIGSGTSVIATAIANSGNNNVQTYSVDAGATLLVTGAILAGGASSAITKTGSGTLILTGANTYPSTTTINAGTVQIGSSGTTGSITNTSRVSVAQGATLAFNRSDSLTYGGTVSGSGGFTKLGAGGLTLSAANTYTGATTIASGTLVTGVASAISGSSTITIGSATSRGYLEIDYPLSISSLTFTGSGGDIVNPSSGTATFTASSGAATITVLSGSNYFHANASLASPTVVNVSDGAFFSFHNNLSGGSNLTKSGAGTMELTGDGDELSGNLFVTGGRVNIGPGMTQLGTGTTTLTNGAILDLNGQSFTNFIDSSGGTILNPGGTATTTITGPTTVSSTSSLLGTYSITSSGSGRFEGAVGNGSTIVTVRVNDGGGSGGRAVFADAVSGSANVTVYAGGTATFDRTVAGYVISHGASTFSGSLLSGAETQVQSGGSATFAAATAAGSTVTVASGGSATFAGSVAGSTTVTGSAVFTSASGLTGSLRTNSGGVATFDDVAATITGAIHNDGQLTIKRTTGSQTISGALQGTGSLVKQGSGLVTLSGANGSFQGPTTISAGTLVAATSTALGTGTVSIGSGASLRLDPGAILANAITTTSTGSILFAGGGLQRTSNQALSTVAQLVAGGTGASVALDPAFAWSARIPGVTYSDVLDLTNTHGKIQILQMTYDQSLLGDASEADIFLGWNSSGSWVNAIDGNIGSSGGSALANATGGYAALGILPTAAYLGSWGRDMTTKTVWAVVNHNSEYAASIIVVPEPGTLALAGAGLAGWSLWRRRRRL